MQDAALPLRTHDSSCPRNRNQDTAPSDPTVVRCLPPKRIPRYFFASDTRAATPRELQPGRPESSRVLGATDFPRSPEKGPRVSGITGPTCEDTQKYSDPWGGHCIAPILVLGRAAESSSLLGSVPFSPPEQPAPGSSWQHSGWLQRRVVMGPRES